MRTASLFLDYAALSTIAFWFTARISRCYRNINNLYCFIILGCLPCLRKSLCCWLTHGGTLHQGRSLSIVLFLLAGLSIRYSDSHGSLVSYNVAIWMHSRADFAVHVLYFIIFHSLENATAGWRMKITRHGREGTHTVTLCTTSPHLLYSPLIFQSQIKFLKAR